VQSRRPIPREGVDTSGNSQAHETNCDEYAPREPCLALDHLDPVEVNFQSMSAPLNEWSTQNFATSAANFLRSGGEPASLGKFLPEKPRWMRTPCWS
jgi:hypothetical protein